VKEKPNKTKSSCQQKKATVAETDSFVEYKLLSLFKGNRRGCGGLSRIGPVGTYSEFIMTRLWEKKKKKHNKTKTEKKKKTQTQQTHKKVITKKNKANTKKKQTSRQTEEVSVSG